MWKSIRLLVLLPLLVLLVVPAGAVELTWGVLDPFIDGETIDIQLGVTLEGVQSVSFQIAGQGGTQGYYCDRFPGDSGTVPRSVDLLLAVPEGESEGLAEAWTWTPQLESYEDDLMVVPAPGHEDWAFLCDGVFTLTYRSSVSTYPEGQFCTGSLPRVLPTVERLLITITMDSYVPPSKTTWGTLKAVYR